jgi:UDP-N-acetylmuramate dehydrogenase
VWLCSDKKEVTLSRNSFTLDAREVQRQIYFGYLDIAGKSAPAGSVLIGARLQLHRRPFAEIQKDIKQRLKQKKSTQPLALASVGCVWKNPPGETASRLIEKVGLKGKRLNGAEISAKHANFIVNRGGAAASDIKALMQLTLDRVRNHYGITLEPEMKTMGEI